MRLGIARLLAVALVCGSLGVNARQSKVVIEGVGHPSATATGRVPECLADGVSGHLRATLAIPFKARLATAGPSIRGSIRISGSPEFELFGNPLPLALSRDTSPPTTRSDGIRPETLRVDQRLSKQDVDVVFSSTASNPTELFVRTKPEVAPGNKQLSFEAVDNTGVVTGVATCRIRVVQPSFSVQEFRVIKVDDAYQLETTVRNHRNAELRDLPWVVSTYRRGLAPGRTAILRSGIVQVVPPRGTAKFSIPWSSRSSTGVVSVSVSLDIGNRLLEAEADLLDNVKTTGKLFPTTTLELDPILAAASFAANLLEVTPCSLGVGDWMDLSWDGWDETPRARGVLFIGTCSAPLGPLPGQPFFGGRADPEAYKGFTLKNGWVISAIDEVDAYPDGDPSLKGTFQWITRPTVGSANPYMQVHLVVSPFQTIKRGVRVFIEGPDNLSPYR